MKIVLIEFIDEAKRLLASFGKDFFLSPNVKVVALHPGVRVFLKKEGISSEDTIPYLDNEAQHRIVLKTEDLSLQIINKLLLKDTFGIEQGYRETCNHHLKFYIGHCLWIIEILKAIREKHSPKVVYACISSSSKEMYTKKGYIQPSERFLGFLAESFCAVYHIEFVGIKMSIKNESLVSRILTSLAHFLAVIVARLDYNFFFPPAGAYKEKIVVPALSYRMNYLVDDIRKICPKLKCFMVWEREPTFKRELGKIYLTLKTHWGRKKNKNVLEAIVHMDLLLGQFPVPQTNRIDFINQFKQLDRFLETALKDEFIHEKIPFLEFVRAKIRYGLQTEILRLQHSTFALFPIFNKIRPALLISFMSAGIYYMMGELANRLGFASLNISHGTHVPPNNIYEKIENHHLAKTVISNTYKTVAVQTPWANKFLDYYKDHRERIETGPLLYATVNKEERMKLRREILGNVTDGKIVVHAATQKSRNSLRFHITETLDEYVATLADIVQAVNKLKDTYLIVRPHPVCDLSKEDYLTLLPECSRMVILDKGPFSRILSAADLLVSFSSTVIEEALQNETPVLLYDRWKRYNHFNLPELLDIHQMNGEFVYYLTNPHLLDKVMEKFLRQQQEGCLKEDTLRAYRFPKGYRDNFLKFIEQTLRGTQEVKNECCVSHG